MIKEPFTGNRNDFASIEEYADSVVNGMKEAVNFNGNDTGSCSTCIDLINLFRDHLIWEINPDYFA